MTAELPAAQGARVALVILSYDGRHLLEQMLPSVASQRLRDLRVTVLDNGSEDDTAAWLAEHWPQVEIVSLERNRGVTRALNACVRAATDAEYVALFNNDMELDPDCLAEMARALDEHPEVGSIAGKLVSFHQRGILDGAGDKLRWGGTGWRRGHGEPDGERFNTPEPVFGACGGAAMYRRTALEAVGLFYEPFFAFFEDVDWSLRARLAGFGCRYVPTAVAYHVGSATLGQGMTDFARYQLTRNGLWLVARDYPALTLLRHLPQIIYAQAAIGYDAARSRQIRVWLRAWRDALRGLPAALRDRRDVQARRRIGLRELEAAIREGAE